MAAQIWLMTCREMREKALQEGHEAEAPILDSDSDPQSNSDSEPEEDEHLPSPLDGALTTQASVYTHTVEVQELSSFAWIGSTLMQRSVLHVWYSLVCHRQAACLTAFKAGRVQHMAKGLC